MTTIVARQKTINLLGQYFAYTAMWHLQLFGYIAWSCSFFGQINNQLPYVIWQWPSIDKCAAQLVHAVFCNAKKISNKKIKNSKSKSIFPSNAKHPLFLTWNCQQEVVRSLFAIRWRQKCDDGWIGDHWRCVMRCECLCLGFCPAGRITLLMLLLLLLFDQTGFHVYVIVVVVNELVFKRYYWQHYVFLVGRRLDDCMRSNLVLLLIRQAAGLFHMAAIARWKDFVDCCRMLIGRVGHGLVVGVRWRDCRGRRCQCRRGHFGGRWNDADERFVFVVDFLVQIVSRVRMMMMMVMMMMAICTQMLICIQQSEQICWCIRTCMLMTGHFLAFNKTKKKTYPVKTLYKYVRGV